MPYETLGSSGVRALEDHESLALVLIEGGARGAYQLGALRAIAEAGLEPSLVAGGSVGAINAAIFAGNAPQNRVERLERFWNDVTWPQPLPIGELPVPLERLSKTAAWLAALTLGQPGFYGPRLAPVLIAQTDTSHASLYDLRPLQATLERLVDFASLTAAHRPQLVVSAVDVASGETVAFDSAKIALGPQHVMASGALLPNFAPVAIDGRFYCDSGTAATTPLRAAADALTPAEQATVLVIDPFEQSGRIPQNIDEADRRKKEIAAATRTRHEANAIARERPELTVVRISYSAPEEEIAGSDREFSLRSLNTRARAGYDDVRSWLAAAGISERSIR